MPIDVQHYLQLLWGMTEKELRVRYKYTLFGFLWLVVNPLLQMIIIGFILNFFLKQSIDHYYYHLYIGLLAWNFFSLSLTKATPSIVNERYLIKKSMFPRSVIPLSIIFSNFLHFLLGLLLLVILTIALGITPVWGILYLVLGLLLLAAFSAGLSLLTSALDVKYRDMKFFIETILTLWFYATPIIYSLSQVPARYLWIWRLNPMTSILQFFQHGLVNAPAPGPAMITANVTSIVVISAIGIIVFQKESKDFDDWV